MNNTRLRWACRRGMLELDLILLPFFENQFSQLSEIEQQAFAALLAEPDQDIYAQILGFQACNNKKFTTILTLIRQYCHVNNH
jgi:antitoxin CptB